jgi:hypothetical protein
MRSITLTAFMPPLPLVDAIRVHDGPTKVDATGASEMEAIVDVREDARCAIDLEALPSPSAGDVTTLGADGGAHTITAGQTMRVFDGWCRVAAPGHVIDLTSRAHGDSAGDASTEVWVHVAIGRGEMIRRWSVLLRLPADSAGSHR